MSKQVEVNNTRGDNQRQVYEQILTEGICPFCMEHFLKVHHNPITIDSTHWIVTQNQWPYKNTSLQLLIIVKRHIETINDLSPKEWINLTEVIQEALKIYSIATGAFCMRFGEPNNNGASVVHLHAHIIVADSKGDEPVRFKIGSDKR